MMLVVYAVLTLYVLIFTIVSTIRGTVKAEEIIKKEAYTDNQTRICNLITGDNKIDIWFWFLKRLSSYTLFKIPLIFVFWKWRKGMHVIPIMTLEENDLIT